MAHSPEKKAKAVSDVLAGGTYEDVAEKHKVAKSTLAKWVTDRADRLVRIVSDGDDE
jgi:transposase-like protein